MDITETYIKMRIAAIPDLGLGNLSTIDIHEQEIDGIDYLVDATGDFYIETEDGSRCQLERQDQLQEMMKVFEPDSLTLQYNFMEWCIPYFSAKGEDIYPWYVVSVTSIEQLWLAFVMKENHNKAWNGKEWITQD